MPSTAKLSPSPKEGKKSTRRNKTALKDVSMNDSSNSLNKSLDDSQSSVTNEHIDDSLSDTNESATTSPVKKSTHGRRPQSKSDTPQKTQKQQQQISNEKDKRNLTLKILIFFIPIIVLIGGLCHIYLDQQNVNTLSTDPPKLLEIFKSNMEHFKSKFPKQSLKFWKTIRASLKRIIQEDYPEYPAVLLMVVPKGPKASQTGTCIAQQLTKIVNSLFNVTATKEKTTIIDIPTAITHLSPDEEKKDLDNQIKDRFENRHLRSIAIDHFEQLSPRASLLFHGYCDGDNAPFKRVAIVFILHTQFDAKYLDENHSAVDKHLMELWSSSESPLDQDKIYPLLSRVANNAAIVTEEENLNCA